MVRQIFEKHTAESVQVILDTGEIENAEEALKQQDISPLIIKKIITKAQGDLFKKYTEIGYQKIKRGASKAEVVELISEDLKGSILVSTLNKIERNYKNIRKNKLRLALKEKNQVHTLLRTYSDDFISQKEVAQWLIEILNSIKADQKRSKRNTILTGLGLFLFGGILTIMTSGLILYYGAIISGIITLVKGLTTKIVEIPDLSSYMKEELQTV
ncbi:hypothetical protein [Sediminitomix flava]|uniref:Uncharacterized protein n=1 Tax=Sediminitomix flava TaxID=379075 RepID=A0A315ZEG1_SEDFL|nr:hypothetical protein [Sediminitomix flava]PWJ43955.1 hypothetical protein BC781_101305 [Sediminitomix flava]